MTKNILKVTIITALLLCSTSANAWDTINIFPLNSGAKWVYSGEWDGDSETNEISVEMRVLRFVNGGGYVAAHMSGHPKDAANIEDGKITPSTYVYYVIGTEVYMITDSYNMEAAMGGRYDPKSEDLFMELPLVPGSVSKPIAGENGWFVEATKIKVPALRNQIEGFSLILKNSDKAELISFAPCVGITSYQYIDYASGENVTLVLSEYKTGN
jgi:hypothetical protein